jgi:hypothetical protein
LKYVKQSKRGSIAVEAALIVPIVIITVMIMIYIMLIIFQTGIMQITANNIAERASAVYFNHGDYMDGSTSKAQISNLGLYRRWSLGSSFELENYKNFALDKLRKNSVLKSKSFSVDIQQRNMIVSQKVTVTLASSYDNPMGTLTAIWGLNKRIELKVQAVAVIDDPAEFLRNTDFILDTASKVPLISDFEGKWHEIVTKVIDYINKLTKEKMSANE